VAIVADDLTGAADTAAGFLAAGFTACVTWETSVPETATIDTDVLAFDTRTRRGPAAEAYAVTARVTASVRRVGCTALYKKIDSLLRGFVGEEVAAAVAAWHPEAVALVAPAFPGTGRTTIGGRVCVDGAPLARPPVAAVLSAAGTRASTVDLATVRGGALVDRLTAREASGDRAIVCDAETDDDLCAIAQAGVMMGRHVVWVGSGGLARALAPHVGVVTPRVSATPGATPGVIRAAPVLLVVGSASAVAQAQVARVAAAGAMRVSVPTSVLIGTEPWSDVVSRVETALRSDLDVVVTVEPLAETPDDERVVAALGRLLVSSARLVGGLVVTGGETAAGLFDAWGITDLRLVEEIEPGVPMSVAHGACVGLPVVTKAGSFGDESTLDRARMRLREREAACPHQ
jgi:4-hydroxythreonine-4-phosphate dehydrogenase